MIRSSPPTQRLSHPPLMARALAFATLSLLVPSTGATASEATSPKILRPSEIDQAVATFTGAGVGEIGGARAAADQRLRLAACAQPLALSWHGTTRSAVKVECSQTLSGVAPWRIFVATRPATQTLSSAPASTRQGPAHPTIRRGDPVTVIVRGRGFTVQQAGEAMENGSVGDWIGVRTARQADPIRARIERPGLAIIPSG
ncbi:MAG: flagella basal body P-ring formation protein FlgA [Pseudomonadota bacterium]